MTFLTLVGIWVFWLIIGSLCLKLMIGGTIDCLKKGKDAKFTSWIGFTSLIIVVITLCKCFK